MTLTVLLIRVLLGYAAGLVAAQVVARFRSDRSGTISILSGFAGCLGTWAPYVLLTSIWAEQAPQESALATLARHADVVCVLTCLGAIGVVEFARNARPATVSERDNSLAAAPTRAVGSSR